MMPRWLRLFSLLVLAGSGMRYVSSANSPPTLFSEVGSQWGLTRPVTYGGVDHQDYILESTGTGVAVFDYDNDGRPDIFMVNGSRLEGFGTGNPPVSMLYRNAGGRFVDVTQASGLSQHGWGQGVCVGDYDNDGWTDLFVSYYGRNVLYRNRGDGTFQERAEQAKVAGAEPHWGAGCAFVDYDRDGNLDLFVANYVAYKDAARLRPGENPFCMWKGFPIMCGPRGLAGDRNILYRNNGNGTFTDVSSAAKIHDTDAHYCFQPITADFDEDGWPDIYVTCDSTPNILYRNNRDGTFTDVAVVSGSGLGADGNEQAGMGVTVSDFDGDGRTDIFVTNFSDDMPALYKNLDKWLFTDVTLGARLGRYSQYVGWGTLFFDLDNDGWDDLFLVNGHISRSVEAKGLGRYRQKRLLYRNNHDGTFDDVSAQGGPAVQTPMASRGLAAEDLDGDGHLDLIITNLNDLPSLLLSQSKDGNWAIISLVGDRSNKSAIGARVSVEAQGRKQSREVRSASSFYSSSGLRLHFGLAKAAKIDVLTVNWPSGEVTRLKDLPINQALIIQEKGGSWASSTRHQ